MNYFLTSVIYTLITSSILILLIKCVLLQNFIAIIITLNATVSALIILFVFYCIHNNNGIPVDALCLFYIISHCIPIMYVIITKNNAKKPI